MDILKESKKMLRLNIEYEKVLIDLRKNSHELIVTNHKLLKATDENRAFVEAELEKLTFGEKELQEKVVAIQKQLVDLKNNLISNNSLAKEYVAAKMNPLILLNVDTTSKLDKMVKKYKEDIEDLEREYFRENEKLIAELDFFIIQEAFENVLGDKEVLRVARNFAALPHDYFRRYMR